MTIAEIEKIYEQLKIKIEPLPPNYDPDTYGRYLMQQIDRGVGVTYSASSNLIQKDDNNLR